MVAAGIRDVSIGDRNALGWNAADDMDVSDIRIRHNAFAKGLCAGLRNWHRSGLDIVGCLGNEFVVQGKVVATRDDLFGSAVID